jgi:hypothetical protein
MTIPFVNTNKVSYNFAMKTRPYIFLFIMILILIFILGVRHGQNIEKNNKVIDYLLSITPTPRPPTPTPVKYQDYKSKKWGIKFTYPVGLKIKEDATASAILIDFKK